MKNGPFECLSIRVWSGKHDFLNLSHHNKNQICCQKGLKSIFLLELRHTKCFVNPSQGGHAELGFVAEKM